ncbi:alpha/beta fold hydrolase [Paenibacillus sacheonensis]|uniref:Alpha/beta fold hydrolase n=1 Tax=Paenibacillus sacheonensis TaxID=742054 RepID=A0A7X4YU82_9BACL|nr:alpha/beta hydrolase [Paenibacillus sacheonensis]MBM7566763.1 pimeloyl-ACP methyl ester carboxylesterase [Paenibacillus sacheonensis]NBC71661.1 alpha/beta fold hydrolase [Paenibacillus sacheonensis]
MSDLNDQNSIMTYRYRQSSRAAAETLLLLHGNGFNSSFWGEMAERLNERYHLLFIDLQGGFEGEITWDILSNALFGVLDALAVREVHIAGHSFGGSLAVAFAERNPSRVKSLVLLSIAMFYPAVEGEHIVHSYLKLIEKEGLRAVARREFIPFLTLLPDGHETIQRIYDAYDRMDGRLYVQLFRLQMLERPIHERRKINCKTLLLAGERDKLYLPQLQSITAGYFEQGSFLVVPHAANAVFIDQPLLTAQWIDEFITRASDRELPQVEKETMASRIPSVLHSVMQTVAQASSSTAGRQFEPTLSVALFHPFQVQLNGVPIADGWDKRYARNILAYVAIHPACTREELCDALFPDVHRSAALNNLRVYLGHLKKLLELPGGDSLLDAGRRHIRLKAVVECDLQTYAAAMKRILLIADEEAKYAAAKQFLPLLGEAPFMTGIYDQWFIDFRSDFEELIAELSKWTALREKQLNRPDSALYFEKFAGSILDDSM